MEKGEKLLNFPRYTNFSALVVIPTRIARITHVLRVHVHECKRTLITVNFGKQRLERGSRPTPFCTPREPHDDRARTRIQPPDPTTINNPMKNRQRRVAERKQRKKCVICNNAFPQSVMRQ
jgi:hypothetical protein